MPDLLQDVTWRFQAALGRAFGPDLAGADPLVRWSANPQMGDLQANAAMSLAKRLQQKPRDVAAKIVEHLAWQDLCDAAPEVAGPGFINLRLRQALLDQRLTAMVGDERVGVEPAAPAQKIVVDYSGPNVAKEMHVGHLRSTIIGDSIARTLAFLGHDVVRQNHLGDWGTQFGMLIEHLVDTGWEQSGDHAISDLDSLYRDAKKRFDADEQFAQRARQRVVALQGGDSRTLELWRKLIEESMRHFRAVYRRLGVLLEDADVRPESSYNPALPGVLEDLERGGLLATSQGAAVVFPEGFKDADGNPLPMIVRKSDGGYLYATTDLAAARYRVRELGAKRIIYVTDARQSDHFAMVFWTLRKAGWAPPEIRLDHVPFGTVLGKDKKPFKTREGGTVKLADLLDEAEKRAEAIIREKDPDMSDAQRREVAHAVGIGALKYADLSNDRIKDYVFDWDRMLSFDGNTAPYLQNAYVRIRSIFRKGNIDPAKLSGDIRIVESAERAIALKLLQFPGVVQGVADALEPHRLCTYLYELAAAYHKFYEHCPVLTAPDEATRLSRLRLSDLVARTLRRGLGLLGIEVVEQM